MDVELILISVPQGLCPDRGFQRHFLTHWALQRIFPVSAWEGWKHQGLLVVLANKEVLSLAL